METTQDYSLLEGSLFQDLGFQIHNLERVEVGFSNRVYKGVLGGEEVYIRMQQDPKVYPVEMAVYQALSAQGVPVPKILGFRGDPPNIGYATMVLAKAEGQPLNELKVSPDQRAVLYLKAGQVLKKMHQVKIPGFGELCLEEGKLKGVSKSYPEYWQGSDNSEANFRYIGQHNLVTDEEYKAVLEVWERISHFNLEQASLAHNDFHGVHIFTDRQEITGVIDFTEATAEDPRYDIAMALFFQNPTEREGFRKGYGELASDPMVHDYLILIAANKIGWRHKNGLREGAEKAIKLLRAELKT